MAERAAKAPPRAAKRVWDAYGWFTIGVLLGIGMVASVWVLPDGFWWDLFRIGVAIAYACAYLMLLATRLKRIYANHHFVAEFILAALSLIGVLVAFALCHTHAGVLDSTQSPSAMTWDFRYAMYVSVATFTTVGFGDFSPMNIGRAIASVQAFTGYVTLGLIASTAASLLQRRAEKDFEQAEEKEQEAEDKEQAAEDKEQAADEKERDADAKSGG